MLRPRLTLQGYTDLGAVLRRKWTVTVLSLVGCGNLRNVLRGLRASLQGGADLGPLLWGNQAALALDTHRETVGLGFGFACKRGGQCRSMLDCLYTALQRRAYRRPVFIGERAATPVSIGRRSYVQQFVSCLRKMLNPMEFSAAILGLLERDDLRFEAECKEIANPARYRLWTTESGLADVGPIPQIETLSGDADIPRLLRSRVEESIYGSHGSSIEVSQYSVKGV